MQRLYQILCFFALVITHGALFKTTVHGIEENLLYPKTPEKPQKQNVQMPEISIQDVQAAFDYARNQTQKKMEMERNFFNKDHIPSPTKISLALRMLPPISNTTNEQHLVQEQLEYATSYLQEKFQLTRAQVKFGLPEVSLPEDEPILKKCQELLETNCNETDKYRTPDGSCNNLRVPNWGRASQWYGVMVDQDFGNGMSSPRESRANCTLPGARELSGRNKKLNLPSKNFTLMTLAWGQFVAHDVGLISSVTVDDNFVSCCPKASSAPYPPTCFPIEIPKNDTFYSKFGQDCMDFQRSASCSVNCKLGTPRRPINQQTGYLDGSIIYGVSKEQTASLRSFIKGGLKYQDTKHGHLLPKSDAPEYDQCSMDNLTCFSSGDPRVNSQPSLTTMHTLAARFHDIVAGIMANNYPNKTDEELFQEAKRITAAAIQAITYKGFLPNLLGPKFMKFFKLEVLESGYTDYDPNVNPTVATEFSTGAYRFGHSLAQDTFEERDKNGQQDGQLELKNSYFYPKYMYDGKMDSLLRGLFCQQSQDLDDNFVTGIADHLFEVRGTGYGVDLVAVGIQRGRDTGLPSYTSLYEYFYNDSIESFEELNKTMTEENWRLLKEAYGPECVKDIDIYLGGFAERHVQGALLGPLFTAIIGYQFQFSKFGDRFYFEHKNQTGSFTNGQLDEIRKMTAAYLICVASDDIRSVTQDVFRMPGTKNPKIPCEIIKQQGPKFQNWFSK